MPIPLRTSIDVAFVCVLYVISVYRYDLLLFLRNETKKVSKEIQKNEKNHFLKLGVRYDDRVVIIDMMKGHFSVIHS